MFKKLLVCFYDCAGDCPVSYQIYNSKGDLIRSLFNSVSDKTLPFSKFPNDYQVHVLAYMDSLSFFPSEPLSFTFADFIKCSDGVDLNIDNCSVIYEKLVNAHLFDECGNEGEDNE